METITWRQSLLIINRSNQIRSDASNCDGRHEQTYRSHFTFPGKRFLAIFIFFCDNDYLSNTKSVTIVIITQLYAKRYKYPPTRKSNIETINENDVIRRSQFSAILCHKPLLSTLYIITHFIYLLHHTTSLLSSSNQRWFHAGKTTSRFSFQRNSAHRNNVTYQSKAMHTMHTNRSWFAPLTSLVHVGWKFGPLR